MILGELLDPGHHARPTARCSASSGRDFLVRGGQNELVEGRGRDRNVVLEFPSYEVALACYRSPEYQPVKALREAASEADILIIEGYDGPQP
jgi:uncharacterized protein (DUF1330 family)